MAYNNIYHKLFGVRRGVNISAIYVNNNINPFRVLLHKSIFSLYNSDNSLIKDLLCSLFYHVSSSITTRWNQVLYSWQDICRFHHYHPVYVFMYIYVGIGVCVHVFVYVLCVIAIFIPIFTLYHVYGMYISEIQIYYYYKFSCIFQTLTNDF